MYILNMFDCILRMPITRCCCRLQQFFIFSNVAVSADLAFPTEATRTMEPSPLFERSDDVFQKKRIGFLVSHIIFSEFLVSFNN